MSLPAAACCRKPEWYDPANLAMRRLVLTSAALLFGAGLLHAQLTWGPADRPKVDAAAADRGRPIWAAECITCHGTQARGTENGPNLVRSELVLHDRSGSELGPFLKKGHRMQSGKPSAGLTDAQVVDLANFIRQRVEDTLRGSPIFKVQDIVTGNPAAGEAYFKGEGGCAACHTATSRSLAGIASRMIPVDLQQRMLFPIPSRGRGAGRGAAATVTTVTVTPRSGRMANERSEVSPRERSGDQGVPASERVGGAAGAQPPGTTMSGVLVQMDDFYVTLRDATGTTHVVKRSADLTVTVDDPLQAHHELLDRITDKNMHDLTAYLVTLK